MTTRIGLRVSLTFFFFFFKKLYAIYISAICSSSLECARHISGFTFFFYPTYLFVNHLMIHYWILYGHKVQLWQCTGGGAVGQNNIPSCVMQMEPQPMPTLRASTPASMRFLAWAAVTTAGEEDKPTSVLEERCAGLETKGLGHGTSWRKTVDS